MSKNYPPFINILERTDLKFHVNVTGLFDLAMAPGDLDGKTKILIALALDALSGSAMGVKSLAQAARGMGVTDAQIAEALRIAHMVAGNAVLEASRAAFEG